MTHYTLGDSHDGSILCLHVGDIVVLRLRENPTTGYRWEIATTMGFVLEADDFIRVPTVDTGGCGERTLRFKVSVEGAACIETVLRRSQQTTPPLKSFSATAAVR